ncbi:MAG: acid phosphatase [Hyphomonas sp.]|nr:acid phosphatase [Hyphomonas sp.]
MKQLIPLTALALIAACQHVPADAPAAPAVETPAEVAAAPPPAPTPGQQWLFASAEASVALRQDWAGIAAYVEETAAGPRPNASVVLSRVGTAGLQTFLPCGDKPYAAVFDADETLIWNLGAMSAFTRMGTEFDPAIWNEWERTGAGKAVPTPGALDGLARIRAAGVTVIVNTNRAAENAEGTEATLTAAGIGDFEHGSSLFLRGDTPDGSGKDLRRERISDDYCVIALVGDQLGDISDVFNQRGLSPSKRKEMTSRPGYETLWGNGWFVLPNPIYGPSIAGDIDDVFPAGTDWAPPAAEPAQ